MKGKRADVQIKRKLWPQTLARIKPENLVFLDESGINTDMTSRYGRSKGKVRVVDSVPLNTPQSTTLFSSIRLDGGTVSVAFEGALKKERFLEYLRDHLIPNLRKDDYVVDLEKARF
ncbi:MAG: transposase [Akkermansia sp.]